MPENIQGQFEKRLYLNTRIKSGGSYTTEGPHGLAFVEELNNYVTENQNKSITLGSSDHKVSILFDGPSTFVRDGIGISSSVPTAITNRLYNNNGDLYWNGTKLNEESITFNFIREDTDSLYLGSSANDVVISGSRSISVNGPNESQIRIADYGISIKTNKYDNEATIFIQGPGRSYILMRDVGMFLSNTAIFIGPSETEINNDIVQFGFDNLETSVLFNGPAIFNAASLFNAPVELSSLSSHPSSRSRKLYNKNGDLYWNGDKLSYAFTYISEDAGGAYIGSNNCGYVDIKANEVKIIDTSIVVGPSETRFYNTSIIVGPEIIISYANQIYFGQEGHQKTSVLFNGPVTFNSTVAFNGPISSGLFLSSNTPSSTSYKLYNNDGDLYWNGSKVGGSSYEHIVEVPNSLYLGWKGDAGTEIDYVETRGEEIVTYFNSLTYNGPSVSFDSIQNFNIDGPGHSNFVIAPEGIRIASHDSIIINGPYSTQISLGVNGIHLGDELNPCTTTIEGPSYFNNTLELRSLSSHPSNRDSKLYNNNGDLCWNGTVVVAGPSNVSLNANEVKINLSAIVTGPNGLSLNGDEVNINGTSIVSGPSKVSLNASEVNINGTAFMAGPSEVKFYDTVFVARPNGLSLNANEVSINGTAFVAGPSEVKFHDSIFVVGPNVIALRSNEIQIGSNSTATTMFIVGPVTMNHLLYLRDTSLVPIGPTDQDFLRNFKGDLYWNQSKVSNSIIEVDYQDVVDEPYKRGSYLTLENNTIYNFDPDHDVDISEINVKPWNTPQLHLYFNNTSSGKSKMTFTYPSEWKWINQSTPPSSSDFKEGYLYCIALRSVANPVYSQSSTTPPYNQQYIVIANIAYEVPVDV